MKYKIGVIISCYNEEKNIPKIYEKLIDSIKTSKKIKDYIIYFIEDNSKDKTKANIKKIIKNDKKVKLISFSKRMGKSIGLQVGFNNIDKSIDLVFMMDADLQDDPKEIDKFIKKIEEGYDLVSGYKKNRKDSIEKKTASKVYNKFVNLVFRMDLHDHNCGFKCFKKEVLKDLKIYDNLHRYITVFVKEEGYSIGEIEVAHHKRIHGKSKYGITRYFIGFKDMVRVKYILLHQKKLSFILDIMIIAIMALLLLINKILFIVLICIYLIIYLILLYNLKKYQKFDINTYKDYYKIY